MSAGDREGDDFGVINLDPVAGLYRFGRPFKGAEKNNRLHGAVSSLVGDVKNPVSKFDFRRLFNKDRRHSKLTHRRSPGNRLSRVVGTDSAADNGREFPAYVNGLNTPSTIFQTVLQPIPLRDRQSPLPRQHGLAFSEQFHSA